MYKVNITFKNGKEKSLMIDTMNASKSRILLTNNEIWKIRPLDVKEIRIEEVKE